MARNVRTIEQRIADAKKTVELLEAKAKAQSGFDADHADVKPVVKSIEKLAKDNGWTTKAIIKALSDKLAPKQSRPRKPKAA